MKSFITVLAGLLFLQVTYAQEKQVDVLLNKGGSLQVEDGVLVYGEKDGQFAVEKYNTDLEKTQSYSHKDPQLKQIVKVEEFPEGYKFWIRSKAFSSKNAVVKLDHDLNELSITEATKEESKEYTKKVFQYEIHGPRYVNKVIGKYKVTTELEKEEGWCLYLRGYLLKDNNLWNTYIREWEIKLEADFVSSEQEYFHPRKFFYDKTSDRLYLVYTIQDLKDSDGWMNISTFLLDINYKEGRINFKRKIDFIQQPHMFSNLYIDNANKELLVVGNYLNKSKYEQLKNRNQVEQMHGLYVANISMTDLKKKNIKYINFQDIGLNKLEEKKKDEIAVRVSHILKKKDGYELHLEKITFHSTSVHIDQGMGSGTAYRVDEFIILNITDSLEIMKHFSLVSRFIKGSELLSLENANTGSKNLLNANMNNIIMNSHIINAFMYESFIYYSSNKNILLYLIGNAIISIDQVILVENPSSSPDYNNHISHLKEEELSFYSYTFISQEEEEEMELIIVSCDRNVIRLEKL